MKKFWKWILGILLVLVVIGALVAVPLVMRSYMFANNTSNPGLQAPYSNSGPMMGNNQGWQHPQMPGNQSYFENRSGRERGFSRDFGFSGRNSPFGFGFMFIGGLLRLIPLALFGLLLFGVYQLGKRSGLRTSQIPAPIPAQPAPVSNPAAEAGNQTPSV